MGQYAQQRPLQSLIHIEHALRRQPRFEHLPQPQRDVGVLGGEFRRLADVDAIESDLVLPRFGDLGEIDGLVIEIAPRHGIEAVTGAAGVDHIRHQHDVVVSGDLGAAQREDLPREFKIMTDLEHAEIFQERLDRRERGCLFDLIGHATAAK